jgi:ketosteroid isomerase-like protein
MRAITLALLVLAAVAVAERGSVATAETPGAAAMDATFKRVFPTRDVEAIVALYGDDAVEVSPFGTFRGKAEVRAFIEGFFQQNPGFNVTFSETAVVLNTAVHRSFFTSDTIKAAGVSRIVAISTTVWGGGTIVSDTAALDLSDPETARFVAATAGR